MLRTIIFSLLLALAAGSVSATTLRVEVNGLVCAFCAQGIAKQVRALPATADVLVSLEHRLVAIALREGQDLSEADLRKAITDAGYSVVGITRSEETLASIRAALGR